MVLALVTVTNLSYTVFLTTSLSTSLLESAGTVFSLSISILSASVFKLAKSDFATKLDVSLPTVRFKSTFVAQRKI